LWTIWLDVERSDGVRDGNGKLSEHPVSWHEEDGIICETWASELDEPWPRQWTTSSLALCVKLVRRVRWLLRWAAL
jgi:hypothetical protein